MVVSVWIWASVKRSSSFKWHSSDGSKITAIYHVQFIFDLQFTYYGDHSSTSAFVLQE